MVVEGGGGTEVDGGRATAAGYRARPQPWRCGVAHRRTRVLEAAIVVWWWRTRRSVRLGRGESQELDFPVRGRVRAAAVEGALTPVPSQAEQLPSRGRRAQFTRVRRKISLFSSLLLLTAKGFSLTPHYPSDPAARPSVPPELCPSTLRLHILLPRERSRTASQRANQTRTSASGDGSSRTMEPPHRYRLPTSQNRFPRMTLPPDGCAEPARFTRWGTGHAKGVLYAPVHAAVTERAIRRQQRRFFLSRGRVGSLSRSPSDCHARQPQAKIRRFGCGETDPPISWRSRHSVSGRTRWIRSPCALLLLLSPLQALHPHLPPRNRLLRRLTDPRNPYLSSRPSFPCPPTTFNDMATHSSSPPTTKSIADLESNGEYESSSTHGSTVKHDSLIPDQSRGTLQMERLKDRLSTKYRILLYGSFALLAYVMSLSASPSSPSTL